MGIASKPIGLKEGFLSQNSGYKIDKETPLQKERKLKRPLSLNTNKLEI